MTSRLHRLRARLAELNLEALLVSTPENRRYLSGFTGSAGYLLISQEDAVLATDFRYTEQAGREAPGFRVACIGADVSWLPRLASDTKAKRIGFEGAHLTVAQHTQFTKALKATPPPERAKLVGTQGVVERLRATKEPGELEAIQRAVDIADTAFEQVAATLRPGMTEGEVAWALERAMRELGAEGISFDTIVATGPNAALPHHRPSDRPLQASEPIVIDMGARHDSYCSDLSRTVRLGALEETFRRVYDTVLEAQRNAIANVRAGMTGEEVDALARSVVQEACYGEAFGHGLGHGVGLAVHELPRLAPTATDVLEDGMVFTIEPGIYLSGWGGVRLEDMVVLKGGKARPLTRAHKQEAPAG